VDKEIKEYQEQREKLLERLKKATRAEIYTNAIRLDMAERGALGPKELAEAELVGILVKNVRLSRGLSEGELAKRSGVSLETVSRVENGRHRPREKTVEKLALALDVRPKQLDPDHVFRRWPDIYQPFLSDHEAAEGEVGRIEREKAHA
jgi:transcriptional regulator with XRE-family HTH domain